MIVGGIVLRHTGMTGGNPEAQLRPISVLLPVKDVIAPNRSVEVGNAVDPGPTFGGKTEPQPFILLGGVPATLGSTVFSNQIVQEWVRGVLGWDEQPDAGLAF